MDFAPFGLIYLPDGAQIERIGHQSVERIGGNRDHAPAANCGGGLIQSFR